MVRLNLVYYGKHDENVDSRILAVRPQYIIANPPHGLWGEVYGHETWWLLQNVAEYQKAGIKVIGYITAGYENTGSGSGIDLYWSSLELNKKLIRNMAEIDHVNGVFIDECSSYPGKGARKYLKELTDLAHRYGLVTWGNVGQDNFDPWYFMNNGFDLMHSTERWCGQYLSLVQHKWGRRISVTGFKKEYTAEDAFKLTLDAWKKGLGYCYISNSEYVSLPSWFEDYASLLQGERSE